jgi:sulfoxide reductase heme-binding subunit YedZ
MRKRIVAHHIPLFFSCLVSVGTLYVTRPYKDVLTKTSFATAYPALVLLVMTLMIGPWNLIAGRRMPVSSDWRRDVGIWAGVLTVIHVVVGQNVHLRGRPWLYYLYDSHAKGPHGLRHDVFGFNNFTGLAGVLIVLLLLVTSNDWSLRWLGTPRWKQLQRMNYACFALSAAHALGYQVMEKQKAAFMVTVGLCIAATCVLQGTGYLLRRRRGRIRVLERMSQSVG